MRLLKTKHYELVEAKDLPDPFPEYAILSHMWISPKDEITYQDLKTRKSDIENDVFKQKGWAKLQRYCDRAARDGWEWAWMDTCCIDKSSPADTQEAINAMFRWYQNAGICYAYLADVDVDRFLEDGVSSDPHEDGIERLDPDQVTSRGNAADPNSFLHKALNPFFVSSKWFTRGWTLQELLAPHYLVFVDQAWRRIGSRESWATEIKEASRIEPRYLTGFNPTDFKTCSVAMRLSWASRRETTVEEDETYSLLGLFGISLPLIYGEGRWQAFNRLQSVLITRYNDDSIFAWKVNTSPQHRSHQLHMQDNNTGWGILAPSVKEFWDASNIKAFTLYGSSFSMTNRGLELNSRLWRRKDNPNLCQIHLNCGFAFSKLIVIQLNNVDGHYERVSVEELGDTGKIKEAEWQKDPTREPMLIRASNFSHSSACSSIFTLEYPESLQLVEKYYVEFRNFHFREPIKVLSSTPGLAQDELCIEPDRVVFLNVELQGENRKCEFDVVISISAAGFPSLGILSRRDPLRVRLGNPMSGAKDTYEELADYLYLSESDTHVFPVVTIEEEENIVVGAHLLPRPRQQRPLPAHLKKFIIREYIIKLSIEADNVASTQQNSRKRKR